MPLPFWLDGPYAPRPPLQRRHETQVAIVGGGLTGIQLAYWLKHLGVRATVLEAGVVGGGATGRNAGFILGGIHTYYAIAKKILGASRTRKLWEISLQSHELLRAIIDGERLDCDYRRAGSYNAALSEREFAEIRRSVRELTADGFKSEVVETFGGFHGACFNPCDGEINPVKFVRTLALRLDPIFENTPVTDLQTQGTDLVIRTQAGEVRAAVGVLATNAYVARVYPFFEDMVHPVRGQMLATAPVRERVIPAPVYANYGMEYFRQLPTGELLLGGGRRLEGQFFSTWEEQPTSQVQEFLDRFLAAHLRPAPVTHRWAGLMGFSCDEIACAGPIPGTVNLFACVGYTGHGLGFSTILSRMVAEMIARGKTDTPSDLFDIRRHT